MTSAAEASAFLLLGLAGSMHCAGMCGPFALSLGWAPVKRRRLALHAAAYVFGKSLSYAMLAALIALGANALERGEVASLARARNALAWIAGASMVLVALPALGLPWRSPSPLARALRRPLAALLGATRATPGAMGALALGLVNGCLPCGLSWSAIALAASCGGTTIVIGPLLFGAATSPVLVSLALCGAAIPPKARSRLQRVAAVGMIAFGLWTAWRGGVPFLPDAGARKLPPCCDVGLPAFSRAQGAREGARRYSLPSSRGVRRSLSTRA